MEIHPNIPYKNIFYNTSNTIIIAEHNNKNRLSKKLINFISYHIPQNKNIFHIIIKSGATKNITSLLPLYINLHYNPNLYSLKIHRILYKKEITEIKKLYETCKYLTELDTTIKNLRKLINENITCISYNNPTKKDLIQLFKIISKYPNIITLKITHNSYNRLLLKLLLKNTTLTTFSDLDFNFYLGLFLKKLIKYPNNKINTLYYQGFLWEKDPLVVHYLALTKNIIYFDKSNFYPGADTILARNMNNLNKKNLKLKHLF